MYGFCCRQNEILILLVCYRLIVVRIEKSKELISSLLNLRGFCFVFKKLSNQEKLAFSAPNNSRKLGIQFWQVGKTQLLYLLRIICVLVSNWSWLYLWDVSLLTSNAFPKHITNHSTGTYMKGVSPAEIFTHPKLSEEARSSWHSFFSSVCHLVRRS